MVSTSTGGRPRAVTAERGAGGTVADPPAPGRFRHEALLWHGTEDFLGRAVPFVLDGLESGDAVMAVVAPHHLAPLRDALGPAADEIRLVDMARLGANPARIIPAWREFTDAHEGRRMRGLGEPIWSGRRESEVAECQLHEALIDHAVAGDTPLWLVCPYDAGTLGEDVLAEARRSHGVVEGRPSVPADGEHAAVLFAAGLPPAPPTASLVAFGPGDLGAVRTTTEARAAAAGLADDRVEDVGLAVHEVAANSVEHGGGHGHLGLWEEAGAFVVEVRDTGRIEDLLVGRRLPSWDDDRGRGLWLANQLCDLVQVRSGATGTTVRIHTWL